ncbi:M23 family metallopeptidase [Mesorhizobium sp. M2A.F.Ca.ET.037.01.1.1]|uniref:M23 family metallopeptidase n=2 Tax=Mesorhizobium TaxID=68287 RepID=UPI000F757C0C|nr:MULTISPECIES: M23 family metallopeptidase [unclassified Mesorhizobium]RUY08543.1 M23 family metallopeptidase [Mesorhizobium sp. M2A.F.Ca.ET.040.01.1.1]RVC67473.1 M23 family metallopeptidase [Mesorhizobium sp. M00.F.Ca.ET.038.03.1.1]AZO34464.1 M23 family metallopeptidase [Mesorhizobium sp. M2A.F.Ca.ET.046.03.2.1]RUX05585.1 M23 family metallopeptidase [Mesorhizobium sp. M2A.F.Ca.ET.037.01.1.1]RWA90181.1 MAG: M23 family metallopeptidase [Mesorhizobium sp.]
MTHSIDTSFKQKKQARLAERRRKLWRRALAGLASLAVVAVATGFYLTKDYWSFGDEDEELHPVEGMEDVPPDASVYVPAIIDLAGDPMWITLAPDADTATKGKTVARPAELDSSEASPQIEIMSDVMLSASEKFMTTIPSTQEDFAFFQAQRQVAPKPSATAPDDQQPGPPAPAVAPDDQQGDPQGDLQNDLQAAPDESDAGSAPKADADDPEAGWGETIDQGEAALPAFKKTAIENNTTVATVTSEYQRFEATEDTFVKILNDRSLDSVALDAHFSADDAKLAGEALKALFNRDGLEAGFVVAMRGFRPNRETTTMSLMQVSIYAKNVYVGTLTRNAAGAFVSGVDPWVREDLFNYSGTSDQGGPKRQYRLLDAIYSTAARNKVPTSVIGEAIMYLSRGQDLDAFASEDQRLVLIYSQTPRGQSEISGRVLYVGVQGADRSLDCFVFQQSDGQYACVTGNDQVRSLTVTNGMVTPVAGVMTSTFGPRKHPILGTVRIHKGVDWAAPVGTPIMAAFDGEISFQGDGGGYGNLVKITHANGRETRYAHMQKFAIASGVGTKVKAGDVIGYIGTTGLSTGPHLHFELYQNGEAIDPLGTVTTVATAVAVSSGGSGDTAVETLTDRIVHVESGGSARAKNPLSSATGAGQFISKTWIRMMNTYRPDLARSLSTADLLALRYDATLSREMVRNLAREGEAYLRARGHQITAGRLYLCHFLGMEGAAQVLAAPGSSQLSAVLGSAVIQANPFLTGKTASYVVDWAERKMGQRVPRVATDQGQPTTTTTEVRQTSPEFEKYKQAITALIGSIQETLEPG